MSKRTFQFNKFSYEMLDCVVYFCLKLFERQRNKNTNMHIQSPKSFHLLNLSVPLSSSKLRLELGVGTVAVWRVIGK